MNQENVNLEDLEVATLGGGCFWCVEAVYQRIKGVKHVISGYSGGQISKPTYKEICTGRTGHAEVVNVYFDPKEISFSDILYIFWRTHNPTTLNRQGNDVGTQYRSVVFYHSDEQKQIAEKSKKETNALKVWDDPIVTEITKAKPFYEAEDYHQNYYNQNSSQSYCVFVIDPKIKKLEKEFQEKLK